MKTRIITGVLGGLFLVALIVNSGLLLELFVALLISIGVWEYHKLARATGINTSFPLMLGIGLTYFITQVVSVHFDRSFILLDNIGILFFLTVLGSFFISRNHLEVKGFLPYVAANLFGVVYPGVLFTYIILIRGISSPFGWQALLFLFTTIWGNDTGAYFIGSFLGKTPLAPKISPKKTVEGALGGLFLGALAGSVLGIIFHFSWSIIPLSIVIGIIGQIGDLLESQIKRGAGIKDSGWIVLGHGGVLDRFDSILLALPFLYHLISFIIRPG